MYSNIHYEWKVKESAVSIGPLRVPRNPLPSSLSKHSVCVSLSDAASHPPWQVLVATARLLQFWWRRVAGTSHNTVLYGPPVNMHRTGAAAALAAAAGSGGPSSSLLRGTVSGGLGRGMTFAAGALGDGAPSPPPTLAPHPHKPTPTPTLPFIHLKGFWKERKLDWVATIPSFPNAKGQVSSLGPPNQRFCT